jgi:hypothetical protein
MSDRSRMDNDVARVKLITIICGNEIEGRLARGLAALGSIRGYTMTPASGRGLHGSRHPGIVDSGNIRVEILVHPSHAPKILGFLGAEFADDAVTAFVQDVDAFPGKHFKAP